MAGGGDPWGLRGKLEVELPDQELLAGVEFGMAAEHERAAIGGGKVNIEHLDGGELVQHGPRGEAVRQRLEPRAQGDVETIGEEGDEDVRFDALDQLMVDRTQSQIVVEGLERRLDFGELDIESPQLGRLASAEIGAQQRAAFAPSDAAQLIAVDRIGELGDLRVDVDDAPGRRRLGGTRPVKATC